MNDITENKIDNDFDDLLESLIEPENKVQLATIGKSHVKETGCINWTVHKVQQEVDPLKEHFVVKRSYRSKADATMITVKHVDCGRTFDISKQYFLSDPHCTECRREEAAKPYADLGIPGYSLVATYYNNRDMIHICHEECGCVFQSSKTSMIAGRRCPICTNHYDFEAVVAAVESCCPGYIVVKGTPLDAADLDTLTYGEGEGTIKPDATSGTVASKDLITGYVNTRDGVIPTGVIMTVAPFAAVTLLGGVGAVTMVMKKRKSSEEE